MGVVQVFKNRIAKHEHPSWAAAFVLDPVYAFKDKDSSMWHLPLLDVSKERIRGIVTLIARLTNSAENAVKEEYDNLAVDGVPDSPATLLDSLVTRTNISTRPSKPQYVLAAVSKRRGWWTAMNSNYPLLAQAAKCLLAVHVTTAAAERNWSAWGRQFQAARAGMKVSTGEKLIFVHVNNGGKHDGIDREMILSVLEEEEEVVGQ